ncbi:MAG: ComF family protein [Spirochaetales bacterium]|nr:ComF family protein [Spirochaetales bacterium]MCF7938839.1 ComF family protein [Spirochaetales bacterium]
MNKYRIREKVCSLCGKPVPSESGRCLVCRERSFSFERHRSVFHYRGDFAYLYRLYKFHKHYELALYFAEVLQDTLYKSFSDIPGFSDLPLVPTPPRPGKKRRAGWDQTEHLTRRLSSYTGRRYLRILKRTGKTPQKTLDYEGRMNNIQGAFEPSVPPAKVPERCILLDDVFTTGSTLSECAETLKKSGVRRIYCLTLARD